MIKLGAKLLRWLCNARPSRPLPLRPSLSLFRPPPVSSPRSLPPRCSEVIAPAEPQAVVASRRLPFLLIRPGSSFLHDSRSRSRIGQEREATPSNQPSPGAPPSPSSCSLTLQTWHFPFRSFFLALKCWDLDPRQPVKHLGCVFKVRHARMVQR